MSHFQFVGVDISKDKFDVALGERAAVFQMNKKGFDQFLKFLGKHTTNPWVCMEATGHYSEILADWLHAKKICVSVANPLQIKSFARTTLTRNKNDNLDAKVIANYAQKMNPRIYSPRSEQQKEMRDLIKLVESLTLQLVQLKNQFDSMQGTLAKKLLKKNIKSLENNIETAKSTIDKYVKTDSGLSKNVELLTSIKGLGNLTAYKILGRIPDLGLFRNAKQFAAFLGLTPRQYQSGKYKGRTVLSKTGSPAFRKAFYMAALVAKRFNTHLKPFVSRLEAANKAPKAIICAVMRKLAHIVFGVLKGQREFDPKLV